MMVGQQGWSGDAPDERSGPGLHRLICASLGNPAVFLLIIHLQRSHGNTTTIRLVTAA